MALDDREWLETDGLGGFASGTVSGVRTRRYHALLLVATTPPTGRMVLVNGFDAWVTTPAGRFALSSQQYTPDVIHPDGWSRVGSFEREPWPRWRYTLPDGTCLEQELLVVRGRPLTLVSWHLPDARPGVRLEVRPLLSGRDYHSMHHENGAFRFADLGADGVVRWQAYDGVPAIVSASNGAYTAAPEWYRSFLYAAERERGLDCVEDLASPGILSWDLSAGAAHWVLSTEPIEGADDLPSAVQRRRGAEAERRARFASPLHRAADAYLVRRGSGSTIIAGYPWFTDWGRDTFIALPGLCLTTGRLCEARDILVEWAGAVSEGMLPNRFPDGGESPEFNAVDASLWYVTAVQAFLDAAGRVGTSVTLADRRTLDRAVLKIIEGFAAGTRHGIHLDQDRLLAAGAPGLQLTWMDARVGDRVITPRIGKPVEVQALWINALAVAARRDPRWTDVQRAATSAFQERFWNAARGCLYDVVDVDSVPGATDASVRPNQVFAIGGLPLSLLRLDRARQVIRAIEQELLTPLGLRTLAPSDPAYIGRYGGGVAARDGAYHQGTAWPWLVYALADAYVRTHPGEMVGDTLARLLEPLRAHLDVAGLGHVAEVASGDPPHTPSGCPFQAWSLAALLRLEQLAEAPGAIARVEEYS